jgi:hypothetical protein
MKLRMPEKRTLIRFLLACVAVVAVSVIVAWGIYVLAGHSAITGLYGSDTGVWRGVRERLMAGRSDVRLEDYIARADTLMLDATFKALALMALLMIGAAAIRRPSIAACGAVLLPLLAVGLFALLEVNPALAYPLRLDAIEYYNLKNTLVPDRELVYRGKPLLDMRLVETADLRSYGLRQVDSVSEWTTDEDGFRNARGVPSCDVVLIGDGMLNSGHTLNDTFGARLERYLNGPTVVNFGTSGHGPFQYVRTFEVYGIKKRPAVAILAFSAGNDLHDVAKYLQWKTGSRRVLAGGYEVGISDSALKFRTVGSQLWKHAREETWHAAATGVFGALGGSPALRPMAGHLAMVRLQGAAFPMVFIDREDPRSPAEIESSDSWRRLTELVARFKAVSLQHDIFPVILFIPTAAHIYAEYSTPESGPEWLKVRDQQIAAKMNLETSVARLSHDLEIPFISLSPPFEAAAREGKALYDWFSVHFTPKGVDVAGAYVADRLKNLVAAAKGTGWYAPPGASGS